MDQCLGISSIEVGISLSEHFRSVNLGFKSKQKRCFLVELDYYPASPSLPGEFLAESD